VFVSGVQVRDQLHPTVGLPIVVPVEVVVVILQISDASRRENHHRLSQLTYARLCLPRRSGRTKQASSDSSDDARLLVFHSTHNVRTAPLLQLAHDAHRLGSNSEPCELLQPRLGTIPL
jgi:hypothetical protein